MSAQFTSTQVCVTKSIFLFFIISFALSVFISPLFASASSLPLGVIAERTCGSIKTNVLANGAGMIQGKVPISISQQRLDTINTQDNCAVVKWNTSVPSTSQIIYGELSQEPVSINLSKAHYGYKNATPQNNSGVAKHTAILNFLEPGKTYSYRIVTRAYPNAIPSISEPVVIVMRTTAITNIKKVVAKQASTVQGANSAKISAAVVAPTKTPPKNVTTASTLEDSTGSNLYTPTGLQISKEESSNGTNGSAGGIQKVPSIASAVAVLDKTSQENSLLQKVRNTFSQREGKEKTSQTDTKTDVFMANTLLTNNYYVLPLLALLVVILFLFKKYVVIAFRFTVRGSLLYWLSGAAIGTVAAMLLHYYYIALVGIALFLAFLTVYLLQTVPTTDTKEKQPKLLEMASIKDILEKRTDKKDSVTETNFDISTDYDSAAGYPKKKAKKSLSQEKS